MANKPGNLAPPPPPPPATSKGKGQQAVFKAYINSKNDPAFKNFANGIYRYATDYGVDPVYFASLLWTEGFGPAHARGVDVATITSSAGAIGPGQIMPLHVGTSLPWAPGKTLTQADLTDPATNIHFAAFYFGSKVAAAGGNYDQAYRGTAGYNQGGPAIFKDIPKAYVPTTTAKSPTDTAQRGAETAAAKAQLAITTTSWAVLGKQGKLKFVTTRDQYDPTTGRTLPQAPNGALKEFGQPLDKGAFLQRFAGITDDWLAYTGQRPSFGEGAAIIANGKSQWQMRQKLAEKPGFVGSSIWKQQAPGYESVYKNIHGPDAKLDVKQVKYAIVNNLGSEGFAQRLRNQPGYERSQEFTQGVASKTNVFSRIYGTPTEADMPAITQAVRHGYDDNQFAQYLRAQPQWKGSAEAQQLWYGLANRMGLIPGKEQTVLG